MNNEDTAPETRTRPTRLPASLVRSARSLTDGNLTGIIWMKTKASSDGRTRRTLCDVPGENRWAYEVGREDGAGRVEAGSARAVRCDFRGRIRRELEEGPLGGIAALQANFGGGGAGLTGWEKQKQLARYRLQQAEDGLESRPMAYLRSTGN